MQSECIHQPPSDAFQAFLEASAERGPPQNDSIHRPMVAIAAALTVGVALGALVPGRWGMGLGAAAIAGLSLVRGLRRGRHQTAAPVLLILASGYLSLQPWLAPRQGPNHAARFADGPAVALRGMVVETPRVRAGRQQFTMALQRTGESRGAGPHRGLVRVTVWGVTPEYDRGDILSFTARLRSPHNFNNPGGFDYQRYLYLKGVRVSAYVTADHVQRLGTAAPGAMPSALDLYRHRIGELIDRAAAPDSAAVLRALTTGERGNVSESLRNTFNRTGVGHLLAISGLHVGIVAALVYGIWIRLLVWWPLMVERAWSAKAAALFAAAAVLVYSLLA